MFFNNPQRVNPRSFVKTATILLGLFCLIFSTYIAIRYANQTPLDLFSFRQTQTALTAYWFVQDGFSLAYQTPVAGPPWSIPFEFPIYQYIVAVVSQIFNVSLTATGRVISFISLVLCLFPIKAIIRSLKLPNSTFYIFVILFFSSPLYLYWGRSFMIETTAVFFTVLSIKYFIDVLKHERVVLSSVLFLIFSTLGILQKATTGLPVLMILSFVYLYFFTRKVSSFRSLILNKKALLGLIYFGIPLLIGGIWTIYTDQVKVNNSLGMEITSSALASWNWGSLSQRFSLNLYQIVIWKRVFLANLGGLLGILIFAMVFYSGTKKTTKWIISIAIAMTLVPFFLFTNLHIVHEYYQTGNLIFIIFALAVSLGVLTEQYIDKRTLFFIFAILIAMSNYKYFSKHYLKVIKKDYNIHNSRDYAVSNVLKESMSQDKYFVAFGNDWSSSFSYLSERKSFTVPEWYKQYTDIAANPEKFIDEKSLGAIVVCPPVKLPTLDILSDWATNNRSWKIGEVQGCYIAVPRQILSIKNQNIVTSDCNASVDIVEVENDANFLKVNGLASLVTTRELTSEQIYITFRKENNDSILFETLSIKQPVDSFYLSPMKKNDILFSSVISKASLNGTFDVGVLVAGKSKKEICKIKKQVVISNGTSQ